MSQEEPNAGLSNFGNWLKNQRLAKKVSLEEIAAVTKIHIRQLRSLEEGWDDSKPAPAFIRGFIVSYAKHLGLNESEVLDQYKHDAGETDEKPTKVQSSPPAYTADSGKALNFGSYNERREQLPLSNLVSKKRALYGVGVLVAACVLVLLIKLGKHASEERNLQKAAEVTNPMPMETKITETNSTISAPPTAAATAPVTAGAASASASAPASEVAPFSGAAPYDVSLLATGDVWVNLKVDDNSLESFHLANGQNRKVAFNRHARITLSNPTQIKFQVGNGEYHTNSPSGNADTIVLPDQKDKLVK